MMRTPSKQPVLLLGMILMAGACNKSPLQPTISDKTYVAPETVAPSPTSLPPTGSSITCTRTKGHNVFYSGSTVDLHYTCDQALTTVVLASAPSFLTGSVSGKVVTITGTAPATATTTKWSFLVNGAATLGDATAITTTIITSTPSVSFKSSTAGIGTSYGSVVSIPYSDVTLDSTWDGSTSDVTVGFLPQTATGGDAPADFDGKALASTDTDAVGLTYGAACPGTGNYVCQAATTDTATSVTGSISALWTWSPYDAGNYSLKVRPLITVEGAVFKLATTTLTFQVPTQTVNGNVPLNIAAGDSANFSLDGSAYRYGLAFSSSASSTSADPIIGLTYVSEPGGGGNIHTNFSRLSIDRTTNPTVASPTGVTQLTTGEQVQLDNQTDTETSRLVALTGADAGNWGHLDFSVVTGGAVEITYSYINDSATAPALKAGYPVTLTDFSSASFVLKSVDLSAPFVDYDGVTRLGFAYIYQDTSMFSSGWHFGFAKIKPDGTADDANFVAYHNGTPEGGITDTTNGIADRIALTMGTGQDSQGNTMPAGFLVYRERTDLYAYWAGTKYETAYITKGPTQLSLNVIPAPFTTPPGADPQSFAAVVATPTGGTETLGVVWRETDANAAGGNGARCYFRRVDAQSLSTSSLSTVVPLTAGGCALPRLFFDQSSGRFVAVFAEQVGDASADWQISSKEISLGISDTASASFKVVDLPSNPSPPAQLEAQLDQGANFMAVLYRLPSSGTIKVHGYHVSPF